MLPVGSLPSRTFPASGAPEPEARCLHVPVGQIGDAVVSTVSCRRHAERWATSHYFPEYGVALPQRGGFRRRVRGVESFVDPTTAFFDTPDVEQDIGHDGDGVAVTLVSLPESTLAALTGDADVPLWAVPTTPAVDVAHRALLGSVRGGSDRFASDEWLATLVGGLVSNGTGGGGAMRPATRRAHASLVDDAREAIAIDPGGVDLRQLAGHLGYSRYHLCRVFRRVTGTTLTQYRNRIRVVRVLDRMGAGETEFAGLAADLGFTDQSHMIRVVKRATGSPPGRLGRWLSAPRDAHGDRTTVPWA
jgi:AraC-like DNA-binding protein